MSYIALYRKWRPLVFEDVVEQQHIVKSLRNSVNSGRIAHAYLFCGTRGTGKTTMAHILSRAINCLNPHNGDPCNECEICRGILTGSLLDVIEIDAASNNSVENVRDIREEVVYTPSKAKYKVYIIDEVHMLSTGAFNALLKTLEEPPEYVVFILATTEPHKLPATILSRCQRYDFRRITSDGIAARLKKIASSGGITVEPDALSLIARLSEGAMRDAISLLDQCISTGNASITKQDVLSIVGMVNENMVSETVDAIKKGDISSLLSIIDSLVRDGKDILKFLSDLIIHYRNLMICSISGNIPGFPDVSAETLMDLKKQSVNFSKDELIYIIRELSSLEPDLKWSSHQRILLETALIKLCEGITSYRSSDILERLSALEKRIEMIHTPGKAHTGAGIPGIKAEKQIQQGNKENTKAGSDATKSEKSAAKDQNKQLLDVWPEILNEIKSSGRMSLYTYLLTAEAVELDGHRIGLVFKNGTDTFKTVVSKPENLEYLEETASKILGYETSIRCISEDALPQERMRPAENKGPNNGTEEKARKIADLFKVDLNIIDD